MYGRTSNDNHGPRHLALILHRHDHAAGWELDDRKRTAGRTVAGRPSNQVSDKFSRDILYVLTVTVWVYAAGEYLGGDLCRVIVWSL